MMTNKFYPKNPDHLPVNLIAISPQYKIKITLAVFSVILFILLYTALIVSTVFLINYTIFHPVQDIHTFPILLKIITTVTAVILFVFTLKSLFKIKNHSLSNRVKLKESENPELWAFILQLCKDTGAPKPKHIYVDPDVNMHVSYTNTWLNLILPAKKELTIGLGLVSCLNLSEFKAVMSHEFGHFAQRSMKIGSSITIAKNSIHDMIFSKDKWDLMLDQWKKSDVKTAVLAWILTPFTWGVKQLLNLFYQPLDRIQSSFSREMEFNADKMAVSTTGSEAIISGLWKLDNGSLNWTNTMNNANLSSQKNAFVKNLYTHHLLAVDKDKAEQDKTYANLPIDVRGGKEFFSSSEKSIVSMYENHPNKDDRQANAKKTFIKCTTDERSPWLLFGYKETLQEEVTTLIYDQYLNKKPDSFIQDKDFAQIIETENSGQQILAK